MIYAQFFFNLFWLSGTVSCWTTLNKSLFKALCDKPADPCVNVKKRILCKKYFYDHVGANIFLNIAIELIVTGSFCMSNLEKSSGQVFFLSLQKHSIGLCDRVTVL